METISAILSEVYAILVEGWTNLTGNDRAVLVIASCVELFALIFCSGIIFDGAVFALSMMISLTLLVITVPSLLRFLANHRVAIDVIVTSFLLVFGFLTGSVTLATSLMFFGLCLSAGLRLAKVVEHRIPESTWDWKSALGIKTKAA